MNNPRATSWNATPTHPADYSGDYQVDLNLKFENLFDDQLDVSVCVLNATDREARLQALDNWHAWWSYARGRSIGLKASWKFWKF